MRVLVFGALALTILPVAVAAQPSLLLGTEELPELWGSGVVNYHPLNPGGTDHDYLAINRSWFDVDAAGERMMLHLRVLDAAGLATASASWYINCQMSATFAIDGSPSGYVAGWLFY